MEDLALGGRDQASLQMSAFIESTENNPLFCSYFSVLDLVGHGCFACVTAPLVQCIIPLTQFRNFISICFSKKLSQIKDYFLI